MLGFVTSNFLTDMKLSNININLEKKSPENYFSCELSGSFTVPIYNIIPVNITKRIFQFIDFLITYWS